MLFYRHEQCILPDNCTKYKYNHHILWDITTNAQNVFKKVMIITQMWHSVKCYFTGNTWYLIIVPNINKITTFFSQISQQILNLYEKNVHTYSNLTQSQILIYMHQWPMLPDHCIQIKKIHPANMEECTRMDIRMERQIYGLDPFLYWPIPLRQSGE